MIDEAQDGARPQPGMPLELATRDTLVRRSHYVMQGSDDVTAPRRHLCAKVGL